MKTNLEFKLNGEMRRLTVDPQRSLLEVLREDLDLTGTKYGCGEGQCRACTVLIDRRPTRACLTEVAEVAGREVLTIEGLAAGSALHPVQAAFLEADAMQCGYCVPGMILETVALLERDPSPSRDAVISALNGHVCRCCAYRNILAAVEKAVRR